MPDKKQCGLCKKKSKLIKTKCCNNWLEVTGEYWTFTISYETLDTKG